MSASTEAPFSFTSKIHGDLFTVRGGDFAEFAQNLTMAADNMDKIVERAATIQGAGNAAPLVNVDVPVQSPGPAPAWATAPQPTPQPANGGWGAPPAAPPAPANGQGPLCKHGMPAKKIPGGVSKKTGNPYTGFYACAMPREQQCDFRMGI